MYCLDGTFEPDSIHEKGPAMRIDGGQYEDSFQGQEVHYNLLYDIVRSIPCPYWPPQATAFRTRFRSYNWPTNASVDEIVSKGCDIVHISHVHCRKVSDRTQWRLSFSRAETILIHTWTHVQKIVFHMLRYFYRKQLPHGSVLASYHLKTLMLWSCEQQPPDFWKSSSLVHITSKLLKRLVQNLRQRYLDNYFISNCNLMIGEHDLQHQPSSGKLYDELITKLMPFTCTDKLAQWFLKNYLAVAASQYSSTQLKNLVDQVVSCTQSEGTFNSTMQQVIVRKFLTEYERQKTFKIFLELTYAMKQIFVMCTTFKISLRMCKLILSNLPEIDHRLFDFYAAFIFIGAAYQIDQTRSLPGHETINLVIEVLIRSEKDKVLCLNRYHKESAEFYLNQALVLLHSATKTEGCKNLLIELAKTCLIKSLECTNGSSFICAVNAYLAALFYETKDNQMAKDCIKLVATKRDHSTCFQCTMQRQLLQIIDRLCYSHILPFKSEKYATTKSVPSGKDAETSPDDVTPEIFALLFLSNIQDTRLYKSNEFVDSSSDAACTGSDGLLRQSHKNRNSSNETEINKFYFHDESQVRLRTSCTPPEEREDRSERSSEDNNVLGDNNSKHLLYIRAVNRLPCSTQINKHETKFTTDPDVSGNTPGCDVSGNLSACNQIKPAAKAKLPETKVPENNACKLKIYSRSQLSSEETKVEKLEPAITKLKVDAYIRSTTTTIATRNVSKASSRGCIKRCILHSRLSLSDTNQVNAPGTNHNCNREICYLRNEHGEASMQLGSINSSKNTNAESETKPLKQRISKTFGVSEQQHYAHTSKVSGSIQRSLVDSLTELSVNHLTAFNCAIEQDADISKHGIFPHNYMMLHHFKCGRFQEASDMCNQIMKLQNLFEVRSVVTDIICSPPVCVLLTDDLKAIAKDYTSRNEIHLINVKVLAAYIQMKCLVHFNKSAIEVASSLIFIRAQAIGHTGKSEELHSKIFSHSRKEILRRYRGRIQEFESDSLLVSENGVTKVVGVS